jgi:tetratricopeptide (TPR) repeat protein
LEQAREMIAERFKPGPKLKIGPPHFWFDQESARILLRECEERFAEADRSVAQITVFEPSLERAAMLRVLGQWHVARDEWREAGDRYAALIKVNQRDDWNHATQDYLEYGTILAELDDGVGFDRLRAATIARFKGTEGRVAAERITKISLLRPTDDKLLAALSPLIEAVMRPFSSSEEKLKNNGSHQAWSAVTLALLEYRRGDYAKANDWARRSLSPAYDLRFSTAVGRVILAMSLHQLGQDDAARAEIQQAHDLIDVRLKNAWDENNWRNWLFGRVLLREAAALLPAKVGR